MVNVLIADDSMLVRMVVKDLLSRDPEIQVIGEVRDGRAAVEETVRLRPDLVIMDVMMPVMDGLEAVSEIMAQCPTPILVLSGNVDPADSRCAFNAIKRGALDVMEKPQGVVTEAFEEIAVQLTRKVKALARVRVMHHFRRRRGAVLAAPESAGRRSILAIGASTGGPKAVMSLVKALPADCRAKVLIVQHISKGFDDGFAEWLDRECRIPVRLARQGERLQPGVALVAPNEAHLEIRQQRVQLLDAPPVNSCRPSVDVLFRSLAASAQADEVLAVLLTGMGRDGAEGMAALKAAGGFNLAQDEASCAVYGMPRAAIELDAVHSVLPLSEIPATVNRLLGAAAGKPVPSPDPLC